MARALVLGGGGVTGIAWEVGVLAGLAEAGVDLSAETVIGTSAGSFVGAALAGGVDLGLLMAEQQAAADDEPGVRTPRSLLVEWVWAYLRGWGHPQRIGAGFGRVARRRRPLHTPEERRQTVRARLRATTWPAALHVTAVDADTGQLRAFTADDGYPLVDVVAASGAVPGISPPVELGGRTWIDGGMVSSANVGLAEGHEQVLVLAPLPTSHGGVPSVADDVALLRRHGKVDLLVPDQASREAIGSNIYDPTRRAATAAAGHQQGLRAAHDITWQ